MEEIKVSIVCNTYNHEEYIEDAIKGFLIQETDFKFEVLIHDDASTDKTADIIRKYEEMYPDIIKPIYQTENQFSQGIRINRTIQHPRAKGKYIAYCEGDDCWTSPDKLQKQVDFIDSHSDCSLVCHNSIKIDYNTKQKNIENPFSEKGYISAKEIILTKDNAWIATASLLIRTEDVLNMPDFYKLSATGDYALRLYCLSKGNIYYFDEPMSIYNFRTPGSWSSGGWKPFIKKRKTNHIEFLNKYNEYTSYKYNNEIKEAIRRREFYYNLSKGNLKAVKNKNVRDLYKKESFKSKLKIHLLYYLPFLFSTNK